MTEGNLKTRPMTLQAAVLAGLFVLACIGVSVALLISKGLS